MDAQSFIDVTEERPRETVEEWTRAFFPQTK